MPIETFGIECVDIKEIAPEVKHFSFKLTEGNTFSYLSGQFITLHFDGPDKEIKRSYSLAAHPDDTSGIEFAASFVEGGFASKILFDLTVGQTLTCSGPYGRLILPQEDPSRYILVATGTGVTPYRAMLPELAKRFEKNSLKAHIMLGIRHKADILYEQDFVTFSEGHPDFQFTAHLSREDLLETPHYRQGYVQHDFRNLDLQPDKDLVYLCGNPDMIDAAYTELKELGFGPQNVKREKYISK